MKNWPSEIKDFLDKKGTVLLIRGAPGTGKTLFSLTLMKNIENSILIAPRKVYLDIKKNYPWIPEKTKERILIIDEKYDYKTTHKFGNLFFLLPESLRFALNKIEDGEANTIILDSWYTLIEELKYKSIEEQERKDIYDPDRFLLNLVKLSDLGVNLIINREGDQEDTLSYVADGVITLNKKMEYGRIYRYLSLDKLRGVRIRRPEYLFTLKDGMANILISLPFEHPRKISEIERKEIKTGESIPSIVFDDILSFERGNTILYDFEEYVPKDYHLVTLMSTAANFLKNNIKTIILPPNDMDMNEIKYQIYLFNLQRYISNLRIIYPESELEDFVVETDFYDVKKIIENMEKCVTDDDMNPLLIIGYDRLFNFLEEHKIMQLIDYMRNFVRKYGGLLIITGKISDKVIKNFSAGLSDIYIKFKNVDGDIVMYGIKPWTRAYHLNLSSHRGYPEMVKEEIL